MWLYENKEFNLEESTAYYGFVYLIQNNINGMKYIGRKYFTKAGYKTVKGKRKKIRKESDWDTYYGSSTKLLADMELYGKEQFTRTILKLCETRGSCNYWEVRYQFEFKVLEDIDELGNPLWYNDWIILKAHRSTIQKRKGTK
jgi:hypothetical protein